MYRAHTLKQSAWYSTVLLSLLVQPCHAQYSQGTPTGNYGAAEFNKKVQSHPLRGTPPNNARKLDRIIDLPEIPTYSGKTEFITGSQMDGDKATSFRLRFYAKEMPDEVGKWYNDALSMYNWKPSDHGAHTVTARSKSGGMATVTVNPTNHKGMGSIVTIMYTHPNS